MSTSTATSTTAAPEHRSWRSTRARLAAATRSGYPEAETTRLRVQLKYERLADRVEEVISSTPPLTSEQRAHLADLLVGTAPSGTTTVEHSSAA